MAREQGPMPENREAKLNQLETLAGDINRALIRDIRQCISHKGNEAYIDTQIRLFTEAKEKLNFVDGE